MGNAVSCLYLFDLYHPKYTTGIQPWEKRVIYSHMIKPDLNKAVKYYRKACTPQDGKKPKIYQNELKYTRDHHIVQKYSCKYDSQYLED